MKYYTLLCLVVILESCTKSASHVCIITVGGVYELLGFALGLHKHHLCRQQVFPPLTKDYLLTHFIHVCILTVKNNCVSYSIYSSSTLLWLLVF